jgi:deoxyribodipyrimidine photo-lyase
MTVTPTLVWFRDDLRLSDHPALTAAVRRDVPLVCLYVFDEDAGRVPGAASRWWLAGSLRALDQRLRELGQRLVLRRGPATIIVPQIAAQTGASHVYWNRRYERRAIATDDTVRAALKQRGIHAATFTANLLAEPDAVTSSMPRVFAPFWRKLRLIADSRDPIPAPKALPPPIPVPSEDIGAWKLEPVAPDWARGLRRTWNPGAQSARRRFHEFLDRIEGYTEERDMPAKPATSRLSPSLRFGEISPAEIVHASLLAADEGRARRDIEKFLSEIGWREFSWHILYRFPDLATRNLQPRFDAFPWRSHPEGLRAWKRGQTGYPIVDAGMRELWDTGWMQNRVRMIAASFLTKHLLIDWRTGEQWFWDTLVDADPANNAASWQWVAGSGADAAPYFRIFNPVLQGERFDKRGDYVRRWVPEIARLPDRFIHRPWEASAAELAAAGVALGKTYPAPIVSHDAARRRALAAFAKCKS